MLIRKAVPRCWLPTEGGKAWGRNEMGARVRFRLKMLKDRSVRKAPFPSMSDCSSSARGHAQSTPPAAVALRVL